MSTNYFKLLLQFHCDQDNEKMLLVENGRKRFCDECNRNILDFRNHSKEEILHYKKSLKGEKFCGIFPDSFIQPEIIIQPRFESCKTGFYNSLMVLATLILLTSCQNDSPTSKKENTAQSDIKKHSNLDSNNKKAYEKDITNHEVPEDFKEIDHMMPEPPFVPGNELAPVDQMDTIKLPKTKIPPEEIFMVVEKMPEFPGGPTKMMEYIKNHLQYPNEAKERNLEGKVYIKFVVNPDGSLTEFKILKTADVIFNQPSLAVLSNMPKWIPGEQGGKKVKVYTIIPFNYKL